MSEIDLKYLKKIYQKYKDKRATFFKKGALIFFSLLFLVSTILFFWIIPQKFDEIKFCNKYTFEKKSHYTDEDLIYLSFCDFDKLKNNYYLNNSLKVNLEFENTYKNAPLNNLNLSESNPALYTRNTLKTFFFQIIKQCFLMLMGFFAIESLNQILKNRNIKNEKLLKVTNWLEEFFRDTAIFLIYGVIIVLAIRGFY